MSLGLLAWGSESIEIGAAGRSCSKNGLSSETMALITSNRGNMQAAGERGPRAEFYENGGASIQYER